MFTLIKTYVSDASVEFIGVDIPLLEAASTMLCTNNFLLVSMYR
jgi:hypothetical protein